MGRALPGFYQNSNTLQVRTVATQLVSMRPTKCGAASVEENVGPLISPTRINVPVEGFAVLFRFSRTLTAVVSRVWLRAGPRPFSVKMRMMRAPRALSTLLVNVGSFVMPKVMLMRTYSVVVLGGTAVMLSKNTGTAGTSELNAVSSGFYSAARIAW